VLPLGDLFAGFKAQEGPTFTFIVHSDRTWIRVDEKSGHWFYRFNVDHLDRHELRNVLTKEWPRHRENNYVAGPLSAYDVNSRLQGYHELVWRV
jgi:hypothetical protein